MELIKGLYYIPNYLSIDVPNIPFVPFMNIRVKIGK